MSSEIIIDKNTTAKSLFENVYDEHPSDFPKVYAELITKQPEYKDIINEAWVKSTMSRMTFDQFKQELFTNLNNPTIFDEDHDL